MERKKMKVEYQNNLMLMLKGEKRQRVHSNCMMKGYSSSDLMIGLVYSPVRIRALLCSAKESLAHEN